MVGGAVLLMLFWLADHCVNGMRPCDAGDAPGDEFHSVRWSLSIDDGDDLTYAIATTSHLFKR